VLSTLGLAPLPLSNNIGDVAHELAYAQAHSGIAGLALVLGTEPFDPFSDSPAPTGASVSPPSATLRHAQTRHPRTRRGRVP
jgi:hypothetical protein